MNGIEKHCENRLKEPIPPTNVALDVLLIPTILVGIRHVGSESVALGIVNFNTLTMDLDVEATAIP